MASKTVDQHSYEKVGTRFWIALILTYLLMPLVLLTIGWDLVWWQGWLLFSIVLGNRNRFTGFSRK